MLDSIVGDPHAVLLCRLTFAPSWHCLPLHRWTLHGRCCRAAGCSTDPTGGMHYDDSHAVIPCDERDDESRGLTQLANTCCVCRHAAKSLCIY